MSRLVVSFGSPVGIEHLLVATVSGYHHGRRASVDPQASRGVRPRSRRVRGPAGGGAGRIKRGHRPLSRRPGGEFTTQPVAPRRGPPPEMSPGGHGPPVPASPTG